MKHALLLGLVATFGFQLKAEDLVEQYQKSRESLSVAEQEQRQVLGSLYNINKKMKVMSAQRTKMTDKVLLAKDDVQVLAKAIAQLEEQVHGQRTLLSTRLRVLYRLNTPSILSVLFSSANSQELDRNVKSLKRIADRDYRQIKSYEANLQKLKAKRAVLKIKVENLLTLQQQLRKQENLLTSEQNSKSKLLHQLKAQQQKTLSKMRKIKAKGHDETIFEAAFFEKKGQLPPPVLGELKQNYGFLVDPTLRFRLTHKGYFYAVPRKTKVQSVFDGRVAFAGNMPGFGKTVIIDHGDHYYTVYANADYLKVSEGDTVREGQSIAESGYGTQHKQPGLYFEIRHFSDAIDPLGWIKDTRTQSFRASQL